MMNITISTDIAAGVADTWAYVQDIARHDEWMHDAAKIVFTTDRTSGVGTRFDVETRIGPFRTTDEMTITEWTEEEVIGVEHTGLVTGTGRFTLAALGDHTTFQWAEDLTLPWWFGGRLGEVFARPILRLVWKRNLANLKRQVEHSIAGHKETEGLTAGALIAQGRDGDVREFGPDLVFRTSRSGSDVGAERKLMIYLHEHGYPVPRLHPHQDDGVMVMDRIHGPTMLADLTSKPWRMRRHANSLAALHERLREVPPPSDMKRLGTGNSIVHLDLHPNNVLISDTGPIVIDWVNAAIGPADLDVALTWVIIKTGSVTGNIVARAVGAGFRESFARMFEFAAGQQRIRANAAAAAELRLLDTNLLVAERDSVFRLARDLQDRPNPARTDDA